MRQKQIHTIVKKAQELSTTAANLLNSLSQFEDANSQPFDLKKPIRGTGSSVSQIAARIHAVVGIITEFDNGLPPEKFSNRIGQAG